MTLIVFSKACSLTNGVLTMTIGDNFIQTIVASQAVVTVAGITNPSLPMQYTFRYYLNSNILNWGSVVFNMPLTAITTATITPLAKKFNSLTPFYVSLQTPAYLEDGYFTWDEPAKAQGRVDISFYIKSPVAVPWFSETPFDKPGRSVSGSIPPGGTIRMSLFILPDSIKELTVRPELVEG